MFQHILSNFYFFDPLLLIYLIIHKFKWHVTILISILVFSKKNTRFGVTFVWTKNKNSSMKSCFECEECDKTFTTTQSLVQHTQIHTGPFTYYGPICRRWFNSHTNYNIHTKSYEGLKYYCQYCGKCFVKKQTYDYYLSLHTG